MTDPIIEIKDATVYRGDTRVFENFSLEVPRGENTAIIGPNGAGKTTFMKLITRDIYPVYSDSSYVRVYGRDRWNVWELRSLLGVISNDLQINYSGNAHGLNVVLSGYYSSIDTWGYQEFAAQQIEQARVIMDDLTISALSEKPYEAMSTGQQRRFLLARALVNDPDALILDEPTSGLDLPMTFHYLDIVRNLMQKGKTIVLVTHHLHEIPPEIKRVVLLKDGTVVADGAKESLLTDYMLSDLFETPIHLVEANGYYQAMPAN